jgi:acyl-CoA reductase-like NAD-dependent aldehyde dehydrogenase
MATATRIKLKNFIDDEFVEPADGATEEVLNHSTGEAIAEAPLSTARTSRSTRSRTTRRSST